MKFSIITPAWNVGPWLPATIESVLSQEGDFDIEYIVVTDPSDDNTVEVARTYYDKVRSGNYPIHARNVEMKVIELQGSDSMYIALNTGFESATGDIYAWVPGDDLYRPGAFKAISQVFTSFPEIQWAKGVGGVIDEDGKILNQGRCVLYYRPWLHKGVYGIEAYHVNQESVFWRASLWQMYKPFPSYIKSMGDYWLWIQFAEQAQLWSVNTPVSYFRKRHNQDSRVYALRCRQNMWQARGNKRPREGWIARLFFLPYYKLSFIPGVQKIMEQLYPFIFPHHPRVYIDMHNDTPVKKTSSTFICPIEKA